MAFDSREQSTHDARQLVAAAIERRAAAHLLLVNDALPEATYIAGLALECLLQALSHLDQTEHDARHRLDVWLSKCSADLQRTLKGVTMRSDWNRVASEWDNRLRYRSTTQLLGFARKARSWRTMKGDDAQRLRRFVQDFVASADKVFMKGLAEWKRRTSS